MVLLLLGLALRVHGIARESIWLDEAVSIRSSQGSVSEVCQANARDTTPPLYFLGLLVWRTVFGDSDALVRSYCTAWSMMGLALIYAFGCLLGGHRLGSTALLLAAVSPFDIYYAQEARMYAQMAALGLLSSVLLWTWLVGERGRRAWVLPAYAASILALVMTHYVGICLVVTQAAFACAWLLLTRQRVRLLHYCAAGVLAAVGFAPWYAYVRHVSSGFVTAFFSWIPPPTPASLVNFLWREFVWGMNPATQDAWWIPGVLLVCGICTLLVRMVAGGAAARPVSRGATGYLVVLLFGPVFLAAALSCLYRPIYYPPRFALLVLPPFILLCAAGALSLARSDVRCTVVGGGCVLSLVALFMQNGVVHKVDWRLLAKAWREQGPPACIEFFPPYDYAPALHYISPPVPKLTLKLLEAQRAQLRESSSTLRGKEIWICSRPGWKPSNNADRTHLDWLLTLGPAKTIPLSTSLHLRSIVADH